MSTFDTANYGRGKKSEDSRRVVTQSGAWVNDQNKYSKDTYCSKDEADRLYRLAQELQDSNRPAHWDFELEVN